MGGERYTQTALAPGKRQGAWRAPLGLVRGISPAPGLIPRPSNMYRSAILSTSSRPRIVVINVSKAIAYCMMILLIGDVCVAEIELLYTVLDVKCYGTLHYGHCCVRMKPGTFM